MKAAGLDLAWEWEKEFSDSFSGVLKPERGPFHEINTTSA